MEIIEEEPEESLSLLPLTVLAPDNYDELIATPSPLFLGLLLLEEFVVNSSDVDDCILAPLL
ncbi:MAG: hypothetical protein ACO26G_02655 [Rickettsiales bacterium]